MKFHNTIILLVCFHFNNLHSQIIKINYDDTIYLDKNYTDIENQDFKLKEIFLNGVYEINWDSSKFIRKQIVSYTNGHENGMWKNITENKNQEIYIMSFDTLVKIMYLDSIGRLHSVIDFKYNELGKESIDYTFYENGNLHYIINGLNDYHFGIYKEWNQDGFLTIIGNYKNGDKDGKWQYFGIDGILDKEYYFVDGKVIKKKIYRK